MSFDYFDSPFVTPEELAMTRKLVYVSGAFTARSQELIQRNIDHAVEMGHVIRRVGATPLVPHIAVVPPKVDGEEGWGIAMQDCLKMMAVCDGVYMLPNYETSRGAKVELAMATEWGLPVFYSMRELSEWVKEAA